ncbi:MAG: TrgA family protein [Rhodobacteraceae bacterium]|nr:TrgA family protein [Paracoccaceae bacterium]
MADRKCLCAEHAGRNRRWRVSGTDGGPGGDHRLEGDGKLGREGLSWCGRVGWKTVIVLVFFALLFFGIYEMLRQSVKMRYDGPFEAVVDVFNQMLTRSVPLGSVGVILVMAVGGAIAGILTENASRRWR